MDIVFVQYNSISSVWLQLCLCQKSKLASRWMCQMSKLVNKKFKSKPDDWRFQFHFISCLYFPLLLFSLVTDSPKRNAGWCSVASLLIRRCVTSSWRPTSDYPGCSHPACQFQDCLKSGRHTYRLCNFFLMVVIVGILIYQLSVHHTYNSLAGK